MQLADVVRGQLQAQVQRQDDVVVLKVVLMTVRSGVSSHPFPLLFQGTERQGSVIDVLDSCSSNFMEMTNKIDFERFPALRPG